MNSKLATFNRIARTAVLAAFALTAGGGLVRASESVLPTASYARVGGPTLMPYGWHDFCGRHPRQCHVANLPARDIRLTPQNWAALNKVNDYVNRLIIPVSNVDEWGTTLDHWDYPQHEEGDCKVYALYKRKLLLQEGFPRQALLMTIVRDLNDEGHTILTIVTDRGEFVLDNLSGRIRPWDATGYRFVKRQSQHDPNLWLSLAGSRGPGAVLASNR